MPRVKVVASFIADNSDRISCLPRRMQTPFLVFSGSFEGSFPIQLLQVGKRGV